MKFRWIHHPKVSRFSVEVLGLVIEGLIRTIRWENHGFEGISNALADASGIFAFWHQDILSSLYWSQGYVSKTLLSRHRDGAWLSKIMLRLGKEPVLGSDRKGGRTAYRELLRSLKEGQTAAIVPDGPRGPRFHVNPGVIRLAAQSGLPILFFAADYAFRFRVSSWDRFKIPLPFSKGTVVAGEPFYVRNNGKEGLEISRKELERRMREVTRQAARSMGHSDPIEELERGK